MTGTTSGGGATAAIAPTELVASPVLPPEVAATLPEEARALLEAWLARAVCTPPASLVSPTSLDDRAMSIGGAEEGVHRQRAAGQPFV